jgi:hypothetical protein
MDHKQDHDVTDEELRQWVDRVLRDAPPANSPEAMQERIRYLIERAYEERLAHALTTPAVAGKILQ